MLPSAKATKVAMADKAFFGRLNPSSGGSRKGLYRCKLVKPFSERLKRAGRSETGSCQRKLCRTTSSEEPVRDPKRMCSANQRTKLDKLRSLKSGQGWLLISEMSIG